MTRTTELLVIVVRSLALFSMRLRLVPVHVEVQGGPRQPEHDAVQLWPEDYLQPNEGNFCTYQREFWRTTE